MTSKGKNVPCEGCRERKKKCTSGHPCDRCKRLSIECIYSSPGRKKDHDHDSTENSHELEADIDELQRLVSSIEGEMAGLQHTPIDDNVHEDTIGDDFPEAENTALVKPTAPVRWHMSLGEHGLSLETHIWSFDDLLQQLRIFGAAVIRDNPSKHSRRLADQTIQTTTLRRFPIFTPIRRANFRAKLRCVAMNEKDSDARESPSSDDTVADHDRRKQEMQELLRNYFSCQFYLSVMMHRATFYSLFVENTPDLLSSPVVCALCAAIITMRCRHIRNIIPCDKQMDAHTFYFSRARALIAAKFDQATLETFMTFLFMALYHINLMHPTRSRRYLEPAIRIRHLLANEFETERKTDTNEYELFKRLHTTLFDVAHKIDFLDNQRGLPDQPPSETVTDGDKDGSNSGRATAQPLSPELAKQISMSKHMPTPLPDETGGAERALMKEVYSTRMCAVLHPYLCATRSLARDAVPASFVLKMEAAFNQYCFNEIPEEYRLSLTIFENDLTDDEFLARLTNDFHLDIAAVFLAIRYYQGLISIHEPFMPSLPRHFTRTKHPERLFIDCDYVTEPEPSDILLTEQMEMHHLRPLEVCYRSAVIIVRLLEFLAFKKEICCNSLKPCFLTACDILVRNACLGLADPEEAQKYAPVRVLKSCRDFCLRCADLLRKGFHYNAADRVLWEHQQNVENEILSALFASRPYTADYWDPFNPGGAW